MNRHVDEMTSSAPTLRIITVSGAHGGVGKTLLATLLIKLLPGFAAIKVSHADLMVSVTDDMVEIMREGMDTRVLKDAGAGEVILIRAGERDVSDALSIAFDMVYQSGAPGVIIEGNAAARFLKPDISFFVTDTDLAGIKPEALPNLEKADVIVLNLQAEDGAPGTVPELEKAVRGHNPTAPIYSAARFISPDGEIIRLLKTRV